MIKLSIKLALSLFCFLFFFFPLCAEIHYISLGRDCQIADALSALRLRKASFPFDWIVSRDFNTVTQAIEEDLQFFLDPDFLAYRPHWIENTRYQFLYNHFFPRDKDQNIFLNYVDYLPALQIKMNRRIQRLIDLLNSDDVIVFIRTHTSPEETKNFVNMIEDKYPLLKFVLVIVNQKQEDERDWNISHVLHYQAYKERGVVDWWHFDEWVTIIEEVKEWITIFYPNSEDDQIIKI